METLAGFSLIFRLPFAMNNQQRPHNEPNHEPNHEPTYHS